MLILSQTICLAQNNTLLHAQKAVYVEFGVYQKGRYPIFFAAVTQDDSINIKLNNIDSLIASVYSSYNYYVPMSTNAFQKSYEILFGRSEEVYNICSLYISEFGEKCNRFRCEKKLLLNTGEVVYVHCVGLYGIFLKMDSKYKSLCDTSLGLPEKNIPDNILVPVSVIDYYKPDFNIIIAENAP